MEICASPRPRTRCVRYSELIGKPQEDWPSALAASSLEFTEEQVVLCANIRGADPKPVLPQEFGKRAIYAHHLSYYAGHFGVAKTYARLAARYWWPGMRNQVR